jgi:ribosome-associated protein
LIATLAQRPDETDATVEALLRLALDQLDDDKAEAVTVISLIGKSSIADYMVIASGRSARQVGSMADHLAETLREAGVKNIGIEGMPQGDWVVIDGRDVIIHLFRPDVRRFYNLEKMWGVDLPAAAASVFDGLDDSAGATARLA